jgi:hypothetical protein
MCKKNEIMREIWPISDSDIPSSFHLLHVLYFPFQYSPTGLALSREQGRVAPSTRNTYSDNRKSVMHYLVKELNRVDSKGGRRIAYRGSSCYFAALSKLASNYSFQSTRRQTSSQWHASTIKKPVVNSLYE